MSTAFTAISGRPKRGMGGFTLLEMIATIAVATLLFTVCASMLSYSSNETEMQIIGQQTRTFGNAVQNYLADNQATIASTATATTPYFINAAMLSSALPGYNPTNEFGQTVCALVLQPSPGVLHAIVIAEGGTPIDDVDLATVVMAMKAPGGGIYTNAPTTLVGALAYYSIPVGNYANANSAGTHCNGTPGAVTFAPGHPVEAIWFSNFNTTSGVLYRNAVPGQPQLNQMNTPIVMNTLQTPGTPCSSIGAFAQNSNQNSFVECGSNGEWNTVGNTVAGISNGGACSTTGQLGSDPNNLAYYCNGEYWMPLVITASYSATTPTPCTTNNVFAVSINTGEELVCRNNFWIRFADLIPSTNPTGQTAIVTDQEFVAAPACAAGGHYWGWFENSNFALDLSIAPPRETLDITATPTSTPSIGWTMSFTVIDTNGNHFDAGYLNLQETFHYGCSY